MRFEPARLAVALLGDRLSGAVIRRDRVKTFVIDAENPAAALRAELDASGVTTRSVALGLARGSVTVKPIELPPVVGETRDMVRFELERHLPFAADDALFDFLPLAPEGEPGQPAEAKRVLIAAADHRVVDAALRLAEDANLRPVSVTVAAHELLALAQPERNQRLAWVHRTGDTADLLLARGGLLVGSRSLPAEDPAALAAEVGRSFALARWRGCDAIWVSGDGADVLKGPLVRREAQSKIERCGHHSSAAPRHAAHTEAPTPPKGGQKDSPQKRRQQEYVGNH